MSDQVLVTRSYLEDTGDAIREKLDNDLAYTPAEFGAAIRSISAVLDTLIVTANGEYAPGAGLDGYDAVSVNVPNTYGAEDEGKVVSNGALVAQTAMAGEITTNGSYDTTLYDNITVNVSGGGGGLSLGIAESGYTLNDLGLSWDNTAEVSVA